MIKYGRNTGKSRSPAFRLRLEFSLQAAVGVQPLGCALGAVKHVRAFSAMTVKRRRLKPVLQLVRDDQVWTDHGKKQGRSNPGAPGRPTRTSTGDRAGLAGLDPTYLPGLAMHRGAGRRGRMPRLRRIKSTGILNHAAKTATLPVSLRRPPATRL